MATAIPNSDASLRWGMRRIDTLWRGSPSQGWAERACHADPTAVQGVKVLYWWSRPW